MDQQSLAQGAVQSAQEVAKSYVQPPADQIMPTVVQSVNVYDLSSYAKRAASITESESNNNNTVRAGLERIRSDVAKTVQTAAVLRNQAYVQTVQAACGDNIQLNSTVPAVIEQTPDTVVQDDAVAATGEMTIKEAYITIEQMDLDADEAARAYAALEQGDPSVVAQLVAERDARAALMSQLDCTKQVAMEMAKESGKQFADDILAELADGSITPNQLSQNIDSLLANAGNSLATYLGAALGGIPNPNWCSTQTISNLGLATQLGLNAINTAANMANIVGTLAINLSDSLNDIYSHGPELLIHVAESAVQTAAQTGLMALRNGAKTSCVTALAAGVVSGGLNIGHTAIKAGISVATTAKDLQGSIEKTISTFQKKDFVGDLKNKVKLHPAVREMDRFIKADKLDLAAYSRLTRTGTKFARAALGSSKQKQLSAVMYHTDPTIQSSRNWINRGRYSTTAEANRYNMFAKSSYSLLDI